MDNQSPHPNHLHWLHTFASLNWYEETIKFIFNFVTKTSELLLAAGIVISTANFLTDGDIMSHNKALSDAWSWAQALAIDSSLGIVFINAFQAVREREKIKAIIFFSLTAILATVAGLITHFDALAHAAGLPVTDKNISGVIPLWIMTSLRAIAVIGFLLASRLKNFSLNALRHEMQREPEQAISIQPEPHPSPAAPQIDYGELATAIVTAIRQVRIVEEIVQEELGAFPEPEDEVEQLSPPKLILLHGGGGQELESHSRNDSAQKEENNTETTTRRRRRKQHTGTTSSREAEQPELGEDAGKQEPQVVNEAPVTLEGEAGTEPVTETVEERLCEAYRLLGEEGVKVTGETLARRAGVRKQRALEWLRQTIH